MIKGNRSGIPHLQARMVNFAAGHQQIFTKTAHASTKMGKPGLKTKQQRNHLPIDPQIKQGDANQQNAADDVDQPGVSCQPARDRFL